MNTAPRCRRYVSRSSLTFCVGGDIGVPILGFPCEFLSSPLKSPPLFFSSQGKLRRPLGVIGSILPSLQPCSRFFFNPLRVQSATSPLQMFSAVIPSLCRASPRTKHVGYKFASPRPIQAHVPHRRSGSPTEKEMA